VRVNHVGPGSAEQADNFPKSPDIIGRRDGVDQMRKDVTHNPQAAGLLQQEPVFARGDLDLTVPMQTADEVQDMNLGAPPLGARD
jgi:hypothetical protein